MTEYGEMAGLLDSASDRRFILARLETLPTSAVIEVGKRVTAGAAVHAIARILGDREILLERAFLSASWRLKTPEFGLRQQSRSGNSEILSMRRICPSA